MAKKKEVIITCNATNVKAVIEGLERGMAALAREEENLLNTIKQRGYAEDAEKKRLKELEKAMDAMRTNIQKNREETKKYELVMKNLSGSTLKDLKKALQEGKNALNKMSEKSPGREKLVDDLKRIQMQIDKNTGATNKLNAANKGLSNTLATTAKNLATYMIGFAGFNKIKSLVEGVFQANLKLSDSLANIRKVSGLSTEAINDMYRQIAKIDTRNTIETLNQLAYTGAKLGIGQQFGVSGLVGFVKAAEQVQMALGEDMGEKALPDLAKMVEVMGLIPKYGVEQSMQKAASAIFQLGATSTATGTNIVEFSKRLYGLANVSRISTQDLLGLASASDAMGLMPEVSATAFNKLFTSIQRQHNLIEKSLGMAKGRIKELYDEGKTMDAIVEIFERMNEKGNLNLLGNIFKDLGSDGARLVNVMATMADRADMLRKHLEVSRNAFQEGEAVIGEYMIQNQTAAALVERAANLWSKAFTNPEGVDMVKEMAQAWYDLSKQMTQSEALMKSLHTSIEWIATAIGALIKLFPVLIRFGMIFGASLGIKGLIAGLGGLITAFRTLYKDIALATGAMGTFNVVMKSNAVLLALSAIATAITLVNDYSKAAEEAAQREAERQAKLKAAFAESKEAVENVVKPLERYKRILEEGNLSEDQKLQVIKDLNRTYQEYLDYLGIEIKSADDLARAYARVVDIMKIKKAYEERESYRQQQNGENRMSRIEGQAKVEAAARSFGVTDINKDWLEQTQNVKGKGTITMRGYADVYREIIEKRMGVKSFQQSGDEITFLEIDGKLVAPGTTSAPRAKRRYRKVSSKELYNALADYITSYRTERSTNKEIDAMFDSEYSWTDKNGKKRKLSEFNIDEYNDIVQKAVYKRKGSLENEKPDKAAAAAAKKAQQDRKKALKLEMDEAQKASTGIISKLEEFYRLQEAAIQEARADGQLTEDQAKEMVRALSIVKNESLATARRAVTSGETAEWDELKTKVLPAIMSDTSEVSRSLLETIQQVAVDKLHDDLKKFNGSVSVEGLDSRAFFDQMRAKAAGNTREAARLRAKIRNEVDKALLQYQFVDQAIEKMRKDLETMGFVTETYDQFAARMQAGIKEKPDTNIGVSESKRSELLEAFKAYGEQAQGPKNAEGEYSQDDADIVRWVQAWSQEGNAEWMKGLPHIDEWLKDAETYKKQIADFYRALLQMYEGYEKQTMRSGDISADAFAAREGRKQVEQGKSQLDQMVGSTISDEQAYRQMGNKFIQQGIINFSYNIDNDEEARQWVHQFATDAKGDIEGWVKVFPELVTWIDLIKRKEQGETLGEIEEQALKDAMPGIRNLFNELLNHSDRVNKAIKQAYEHEKEQQDMRFQVAGYRKQEEETDSAWESVGKQKDAGIGQSLAEQIGVDKIADDPEIQRIQNRIYWRNKELEEAKAIFQQRQEQNELELQALRDRNATEQEIEALRLQQKQDNAGIEELIKARQTELFNETSNLATQVSQQLQKRVNAIQSLTKPITDFTQAAGRKIGDMIFNMESEEATWEELWKNMALAVGESVIQMGAQYAQNLLMQQAMNRASEAETVADAGVKVSAGIAAGSAKTIGELGWWGIPLIAVISSVLMGLLQSALSTKSNKDGSSSSSSSASSSAVRTKLVSGMLTYDEGNVGDFARGDSASGRLLPTGRKNVDRFAGRRKLYDDGTTQVYGGRHQYQGDGGRHQYRGDDGQSYRATAVAAPADGLVTQPIATMVQGQPALVAERGPEIVIGRRTTRAIMMNEPGLIRYLANYGKSGGAQAGPRYRAFDGGNLDDITQQLPDGQTTTGGGGNTVGTDPELRNTLAALTQVVGSLQQQLDKGIKSTINMYGSDGLYENMNKANKFMGRYGR